MTVSVVQTAGVVVGFFRGEPKFRKNLKKIAPIWQFRDQMSCKLFIINDRVFSIFICSA